MTAAVMQAQLFDDADAPWNSLMAAATIYSLPPVAIFLRAPPHHDGGP